MVTDPEKTDGGKKVLNYGSEESQPSSIEITRYSDGGVTVVLPSRPSKLVKSGSIPVSLLATALCFVFATAWDIYLLSALRHRITGPIEAGAMVLVLGGIHLGYAFFLLTELSPYISPQIPTRIGISRRRVFVSVRGLLMSRQFSAPRTRLLEIKLNAPDDRDRKKVYTISIDVLYRRPEYITNLSQSDAVKIYDALKEAMELTAKSNEGPH